MKPENIEKAKKLCQSLDHVQMKLDTLVDERKRSLKDKDSLDICLFSNREPFEVSHNSYQSILMELISSYQIQKDRLLKQIGEL